LATISWSLWREKMFFTQKVPEMAMSQRRRGTRSQQLLDDEFHHSLCRQDRLGRV
jgi:hypothetical protein